MARSTRGGRRMTEKELEQQSEEFKKRFSVGYEDGKQNKRKLQLSKTNLLRDVERLEKEKCELLGLIQAKDKLIEKMKRCKNCEFNFPICDTHCQDCDEHYSNWRLAE